MIYIYILLISILFSQELNVDPFSSNQGTTGSIGTVTINNEVYNQLSLRPEIPIGNMGVGLDIYLYFNDDGMYWESWDFSNGSAAYRTIVDKIYYLRWGQPGDNLYFRAGALESVTLGQGILVNNYSNIMEYPQVRQVGFDFQTNFADIGLELIHSNFKVASPGIIGLRASYKNFGVSFVTDLNQNAGLKDSDGDSYPDNYDDYPDNDGKHNEAWEIYLDNPDAWEQQFNCSGDEACLQNALANLLGDTYNDYDPESTDKDPISAVAIDVTYSLSRNMTLYTQIAQLFGETSYSQLLVSEKLGWGAVPLGVRAKLGPINFLAEFRINSRRFIFNYWDRAYDVNRITINSVGESITKESLLYQYGKLIGFYSQANMDLMNMFTFGFGYQNMKGEKWDSTNGEYMDDESNQTLLSTITINPSLIPKVGKAQAFYQQSNVSNPFEFKANSSTIWGYDLGVEVSSGVMLIYQARTTYITDLDNSGEFIPQKSVQIETQFLF